MREKVVQKLYQNGGVVVQISFLTMKTFNLEVLNEFT